MEDNENNGQRRAYHFMSSTGAFGSGELISQPQLKLHCQLVTDCNSKLYQVHQPLSSEIICLFVFSCCLFLYHLKWLAVTYSSTYSTSNLANVYFVCMCVCLSVCVALSSAAASQKKFFCRCLSKGCLSKRPDTDTTDENPPPSSTEATNTQPFDSSHLAAIHSWIRGNLVTKGAN